MHFCINLGGIMESVKETVLYIFKDLKIKVSSLDEILDIDSLEWVDLIMYLEEDFTIEIPDEDIPSLKTINEIISYVETVQAMDERWYGR